VEHKHGNRKGCLRATRVALLEEIGHWTKDLTQPSILWLNGLAGTGKSTIAQTVAEQCFANGILGGSFFCSANVARKDHSDPSIIFPTLGFQLAQKYPKARSTIVTLLQSNPDVAHESLESQAEKFLIAPLQSAGIATVIVIDALDECGDKKSISTLLSVFGTIVRQTPKAKFFITSRPEPWIKDGFSHLETISNVSTLHNIPSNVINSDIKLFLRHELSWLASKHALDNWPSDAQLDLLCDRAAGLFAYAIATVRFLDHVFRGPDNRYTIIAKSPDDTVHEGTMEGVHGGLSLDSLCTSILQTSFKNNTAEDDSTVRFVLTAAALFTPPFLPSAIPEKVYMQTGEVVEMKEVKRILESIHPLLKLCDNLDDPVSPFHKLFSDCLANPVRCSDKRFLIPGS